MFRTTSLLAALAGFAALLPAQNKSQEELAKLRDEKLAKPVFKQAPWRTDYDEARREAAEQHKLIFAYFTRSYDH